jgi:hypothetical protein
MKKVELLAPAGLPAKAQIIFLNSNIYEKR